MRYLALSFFFSVSLNDLSFPESLVLFRSGDYTQKNPFAKDRHEQIPT